MFWFGILILFLLVIGASVLGGKVIEGRKRPRKGVSREEMLALKSSGAFPNRKENMP